MKANNLAISIPNMGCNKNCPYCVAKCSGFVDADWDNMKRNLPIVKNLAHTSEISSILFTGKGEPLLNMPQLLALLYEFQGYITEVQTNGIWLQQHPEAIKALAQAGLKVVAISVDSLSSSLVSDIVGGIKAQNMLARVTYNVTNKEHTFNDLFKAMWAWDVDQFTLRNIVAPNFTEETLQHKWIRKNVTPGLYDRLKAEMVQACKNEGHHIRNLPYGAKVYDLHGMAVSFSDYCIQDTNDSDNIRSLIYMEDGHMYTSWNSKASRLF